MSNLRYKTTSWTDSSHKYCGVRDMQLLYVKEVRPIQNSEHIMKIGQDFLGIQYIDIEVISDSDP